MNDQIKETCKHISCVSGYIEIITKVLLTRAILHDQSKLFSPEREIFDEYTPKLKSTTYDSDEYKRYLREMKVALDHHYAANRHHPEHFKNGIRDMSLIDITEMLCDWKAATLRHDDGDIKKSIELNQRRFGYSDELKNILLNTVEVLEPK